MQVITSDKYNKFKDRNTCLAIGAFDGLHKGHQLIINQAIKEAKNNNYPAAVLSFHPHPLEIIPGKTPPPSIVSRQQKISVLEEMGVDYYFEQKFTQQFAKMRAEEFINNILLNKIKVNTVVVGDDFRFAYKNEGNVEILKKMGELHGYQAKIISQLHASDDRISSTRIRNLLKKGRIKKAKKLLGRPYQICGQVVHGKKRGRKLGFPTANLSLETNYALPPEGVYAVKVHHQDQVYIGAANLGYNPTFNNQKISFEVYILDFEDNLYGERLCVDIIDFIRSEIDFKNTEELIEQMEQDILYTRELLC
ncbi:riboflavin kinase/FMN adenylyltransferase [Halanaerobium saccharolyticum]|uniref:Riboflavin biosynthesis protein n=1 Tax=Halanaerobium saccharolyticum TaxID=43595 RepID=A0A2T5RPA7_9FIRM|nr:bifunctional riboflavin kinase/FAD synthetase [Halanaerobium saccharolyticum]PTW01664.1 riboflavin kinase/FMN adenylyltransferase [Halanaerobium saccharolyticum]